MRTEEQKVAQAPITVILGGKRYPVKPLVIRDSRAWKGRVIELVKQLPQLVQTTIDDPEIFGEGLTQLLIKNPDHVIDLFFEYARDLDRDEIEGIATDVEMATAFEEVVKIAFPLAESLPKVLGRLSQ